MSPSDPRGQSSVRAAGRASPLAAPSPPRLLLLPFGLLTLVWGVYTAATLAAGNRELITWSFTHWAFTYDYGVIKRGLVGEVLGWFVQPPNLFPVVRHIAWFDSIAVSLLLAVLFFRPARRYGGDGLCEFGILATSHFATLQHFFYDVGRFDHVGLAISLACFACIERLRPMAAAVALVGACTLGIVIHEAFAVIFLPLILAYWLYHRAGPTSDMRLLTVVTSLLALVVLVMISRGRPALGETAYVQTLRDLHGEWINARSVGVLYGSVTNEAGRSVALFLTSRRLFQHAVLAAFLLPSLLLLGAAIRGVWRDGLRRSRRGWRAAALLVAAASPLALYPIGIDFARWWALAITNLLMALSLLLLASERWRTAVGGAIAEHRLLVWATVVCSLIAGPLGVASSPFPKIDSAINDAILALVRAIR